MPGSLLNALHGLIHSERLQETGRLDMSSQLPTVSLSAVSGRNGSTPGGLVQSPAVTHHVPGQCGVRGWRGGHVQTSRSFRLKRLMRQNGRPRRSLCVPSTAGRRAPSSWLRREAGCLRYQGAKAWAASEGGAAGRTCGPGPRPSLHSSWLNKFWLRNKIRL